MTFTELELALLLAVGVLLYLYLDLARVARENKRRIVQMFDAIADRKITLRRNNDGAIDFIPTTRS